jgi:hypothetical protein
VAACALQRHGFDIESAGQDHGTVKRYEFRGIRRKLRHRTERVAVRTKVSGQLNAEGGDTIGGHALVPKADGRLGRAGRVRH